MPVMTPLEFQGITNVSRETFLKYELYLGQLTKWQRAVNLVGDKTLNDAWRRHFLDSRQLLEHIPCEARVLVDLGSGAGFPGLVLALESDLTIHLVESDMRKSIFLEETVRDLGLTNVIVHNRRIEDIELGAVDVITARALAPLTGLLEFCELFTEKDSSPLCLFLKGVRAREEIEAAKNIWTFEAELIKSQTDEHGNILRIKNLQV